jgi:hypothetical protein
MGTASRRRRSVSELESVVDGYALTSGYSSLRQARGSAGSRFGVRSSRNEEYGATNRSGALTV